MPDRLIFKAGRVARRHIAENGLHPSAIRAVVGASGAAKWLGICGLDQAIFGRWLPSSGSQPIDLLGTSIGTFKLAASCQDAPEAGLAALAEAYIAQTYGGKPTPDEISRETARIVDIVLPDGGAALRTHPRYRFHAGTVLSQGSLASEDHGAQKRAMLIGFFANLVGRRQLKRVAKRVLFSDRRSDWRVDALDGVPSEQVELTKSNVVEAVVASGALPVYMRGVTGISGAPGGVFRDGGLLDYHPVPNLIFAPRPGTGVVLYPHFFGSITPGWFDKFLPWRRARGAVLDDVLLVGPSPAYLASLPGGQMPDRADFLNLSDEQRQRNWRLALAESNALGDEFLDCVGNTERLLKRIEPLD